MLYMFINLNLDKVDNEDTYLNTISIAKMIISFNNYNTIQNAEQFYCLIKFLQLLYMMHVHWKWIRN